MSNRRGMIMLMFDLPVKTPKERRIYSQFRKAIIKRGYILFQKSVYIKLLRNISSARMEKNWIDSEAPADGRIHALNMNLEEFRKLTAIRGEPFNISIFADDVVFIGEEEDSYINDDELFALDLDKEKTP